MKQKRTKQARHLMRIDPCCVYCGRECSLRVGATHPLRATIDHKKALSNGGLDKSENRVLACFRCNQLKRSHDYRWFVDSINLIGIDELEAVFEFKVGLNRRERIARRQEQRVKRQAGRVADLAVLLYVVDRWPPVWYPVEMQQMEMAA